MSNVLEQKYKGFFGAMDRSQAIIEFDLNGTVLSANQNFLFALGYQADEIIGKHHRLFCNPDYVLTDDYRKFWQRLGQGEFISGEFERIAKSGQNVWIQASYNPVLDEKGVVQSVVKFATVITSQKLQSAEHVSLTNAVRRSQAVIEFALDGTILAANENFLKLMGYRLSEIQGKHHRIFCDPGYAATQDYQDFWARLGQGEFESGEFQRHAKSGDLVWIQATYNPILDASGKPSKVIKLASDITKQKLLNGEYLGKVDAISRSQAVIEFDLNGNIIQANDNFLSVTGYTQAEIVGKHHRIFCTPEYAATKDYEKFWNDLRAGQFMEGNYKRIKKNDDSFWIKATYNPIFDLTGRPFKVVKFAMDITEEKQRSAEISSKLDAISRSQAVIEFSLEGVVLDVNDNFLSVMKYQKADIIGKHHRIFCQEKVWKSAEYLSFWDRLGKGEFFQDEYLRVNSAGEEVWIQASYNPVFNSNGEAFKIIKLATDITKQKKLSNLIQDVGQNIISHVANLTRSSNEISSAALESETIANKNRDCAAGGLDKVQKAIQSTSALEKNSKEIALIVNQIQDLSERTNLIAFNATIEAVRAGELGRGFSVVADEVRKLADRSADAALKISDLVKEALVLAEASLQYSDQVVSTFGEISQGISKTANGVAVIGGATQLQSVVSNKIQEEVQRISTDSPSKSNSGDPFKVAA